MEDDSSVSAKTLTPPHSDGEVARRAGGVIKPPVHLRPMERLVDGLDDLLRPHQHVIVPEAEDAEARRPEEAVATCVIGCALHMLAAIEFNDDVAIKAGEIANVEADLVLTPELEAAELATTEVLPKKTFSIGR